MRLWTKLIYNYQLDIETFEGGSGAVFGLKTARLESAKSPRLSTSAVNGQSEHEGNPESRVRKLSPLRSFVNPAQEQGSTVGDAVNPPPPPFSTNIFINAKLWSSPKSLILNPEATDILQSGA